MNGFLFNICGVDGSGKTTQSILLKENLQKHSKRNVIIVHGFKPNLYSGELKKISHDLGESLEKIFSPKMCSLSFLGDLIENCKNTIIPNLEKGNIVITEKYILDSIVYLDLIGSDSSTAKLIKHSLPIPNIRFLLDVNPNLAVNRILQRSIQTNKQIAPKENFEIIKMARQNFINIVQEDTKTNIIINSENDINKNSDLIFENIKKRIPEIFE